LPQYSRYNALDQILDVQGSSEQSSIRTLTDETGGLGVPIIGQSGGAAAVTTFIGGLATITGLTGMTPNSVGRFLSLSNAIIPGNNGTFLIITYVSALSVVVSNSGGFAPDPNNGLINWVERRPYCLNDDLDFERTDREAIKGVSYDAVIPTYQRPTAIGTDIPANLTNIASKTTDARGFIINRKFAAAIVAPANTRITITSPGNLKHSDSVDKTGVPCFDAVPYTSDYPSCYVEILNPVDGTQLEVRAGIHAGEKIYGITRGGVSVSPNSVEVVFYSVPYGGDISTSSTAYTWEVGLPTSIDLFYGYFQRLDQLSDNAFRTVLSLGIEETGDLRQDIDDIQVTIGMNDGDKSLAGHLTNTGNYFPFVNLPDVTPSVVEALNTLNAQIGNRDYTGAVLTDGQTITASLQALSNAITASSVVRTIERLSGDVNANVPHTLPGGITYTPDITGNGRNLWVFWRGLLRDPGTVANGDDYAETSGTQITSYTKIKDKDHINYLILQ
jgi:hypothetical protein